MQSIYFPFQALNFHTIFFSIGMILFCEPSIFSAGAVKNAKMPVYIYNEAYDNANNIFGSLLFNFQYGKYKRIADRLRRIFYTLGEFDKGIEVLLNFPLPKISYQDLIGFHDADYINTLFFSWKKLFLRTIVWFGFLNIVSCYCKLKNHPIKIVFLTIYALFGLETAQAKLFSKIFYNDELNFRRFMILPYPLIKYLILTPMLTGVAGTMLALEKAIDPNEQQFIHGPCWTVNLFGGFSNAKKSCGGYGHCFNDLGITLTKKIASNKDFKALIISSNIYLNDGDNELQKKYPTNITIIEVFKNFSYENFKKSYTGRKTFPENTYYIEQIEKIILEKKDTYNCIVYQYPCKMYKKNKSHNYDHYEIKLKKKDIERITSLVVQYSCNTNTPLVILATNTYEKEKIFNSDLTFENDLKVMQRASNKQLKKS